MEDEIWRARAHFLCREKLYQAMAETVKGNEAPGTAVDSSRRFYRGVACLFVDRISEAEELLTPLQEDPVVHLGALLATIYIYKHCRTGSSEALSSLEATLRQRRRKAGNESLYHAVLFLHLVDHQEKAREYAERLEPVGTDALALRGWVEARCAADRGPAAAVDGRTTSVLEPLKRFDAVLAQQPGHLDAVYGKMEHLLRMGKASEAVAVATRASVRLAAGLQTELSVLRTRACLAAKDWDAVAEASKKLAAAPPATPSLTIKVLQMQILVTICRDGSFIDALPLLKRLLAALEQCEGRNAELFVDSARLFSRVCGRHLPILAECLPLVQRAVHLEPTNPLHLSELALQQLMQGRLQDSLHTSRSAAKLADGALDVMLQTIHCLVEDEQYAAARQQLAVVEELHEASPSVPAIHYIKAALLREDHGAKEGGSATLALHHLSRAFELHVAGVATLPYGVEYLIQLNPDFLLALAQEYLHHGADESAEALAQMKRVLDTVVEACPGLLPALYRLADAQWRLADGRAAEATLRHVIDNVDPTFVDAYLLLARIRLDAGDGHQAAQHLEMGLSYNFEVRDHPLYHLLMARIQRTHRNDAEAALASLRTALVLAGMRPASAGAGRGVSGGGQGAAAAAARPFSPADKAVAYVELFHALMAGDNKTEAGHVIHEALQQLKGTVHEGRVLLAQVDYLLNQDEIEAALGRLRSLPASHPQFVAARRKMAHVYLHRLRDEHNYFRCYEEIAKHGEENAAALTDLGDAHLVLHQADQAVAAYQRALQLEPRSPLLASKIGAALVLTHQYTKAVNYFKDALREPANAGLRVEYAGLLHRLGQSDKAEQVIGEWLTPPRTPMPSQVEQLQQQVDLLLLLAKIRDKSETNANRTSAAKEGPMAVLARAQEVMALLLRQIPYDQPEVLAGHKRTAATIAVQMADLAVAERDLDKATRLYRDALAHDSTNAQSMGQLAKVYLETGDHEACQVLCKSLLKIDRENDEARTMVAQIALRTNDLAEAATHFGHVLERQPRHYVALSQLIETCQRRGGLTEAEQRLQAAERDAGAVHGHNEPGLVFCRGLYEFYAGQSNAALLALNRARGHPVWGQKAIRLMLDICLSGEGAQVGPLDASGEGAADTSALQAQDTELMALHTAAKLVQELQPLDGDALQTHRLYPEFYLLATRQKANVERALQQLTALASAQAGPGVRDNPGAVLGIATAHLLLKQTQRAKNQLKRLSKSTWLLEEGDYLERCWLLLADVYIQAGKSEAANHLLRRVLNFNRSCAKAFEYLGYILEKEQSFQEAAQHLESAWRLTNASSATVGYKLALCHLKSKQLSDALDVCHTVLVKHPHHPRIRKDVMDKAVASLRS